MGLFFNHIPKCGGTTFQSWVVDAYWNEKIAASHLDPSINAIKSLGELVTQEFNIIMSHAGSQARAQFFSDWLSVCIIREPVARFKSAVIHGLSGEHITDDIARDWCSPGGSLPVASMASCITKRPYSEKSLREEISSYTLVLTPEKIPSAARILFAIAGTSPPSSYEGRVNETTAGRKAAFAFPSDLESILRAKIPQDFFAYELALALQNEWIRSASEKPIDFFRELNSVFNRSSQPQAFSALALSRFAGWSRLVSYPKESVFVDYPFRLLVSRSGAIRCFLPTTAKVVYALVSFFSKVSESFANPEELVGFSLGDDDLVVEPCRPSNPTLDNDLLDAIKAIKVFLPPDPRNQPSQLCIYSKKGDNICIRLHGIMVQSIEIPTEKERGVIMNAIANANSELMLPLP